MINIHSPGRVRPPRPGEKPAEPETRHSLQRWPVPLTAEEIQAAGLELAELLTQVDERKEALKAERDALKEALKPVQKRINELQWSLSKRLRYDGEVPVTETWDWAQGMVTTTRDDTGEVVEEREIAESERQVGL